MVALSENTCKATHVAVHVLVVVIATRKAVYLKFFVNNNAAKLKPPPSPPVLRLISLLPVKLYAVRFVVAKRSSSQPPPAIHSFSTAHVHPELGHNHDYDDDGAFIPTATDKRLLLSRRWAHFTLLLLGNWILLIFCPFSFRTPPIDGVETIIPLSIRYAVHTESNEQFILFPY